MVEGDTGRYGTPCLFDPSTFGSIRFLENDIIYKGALFKTPKEKSK